MEEKKFIVSYCPKEQKDLTGPSGRLIIMAGTKKGARDLAMKRIGEKYKVIEVKE